MLWVKSGTSTYEIAPPGLSFWNLDSRASLSNALISSNTGTSFEWLTKALLRIDEECRDEQQINKFHLMRDFTFFSMVVDRDGSCIVHPEGKKTALTDPDVLKDLEQHKTGVIEMDVAGEPSLVFYGPIDGIDWSVAIVAPISDLSKPFRYMRWALLLLSILGIVAIGSICKRM